MRAGRSPDENARNGYVPFIDKNGVTQGSPLSNRLFEASDVYNDILLHLKGKISDTATVNVDLDFQNYLSSLENTARAGEATPIGGLTNGTYDTQCTRPTWTRPCRWGRSAAHR